MFYLLIGQIFELIVNCHTVCIPQLNGYNGRGPSQCWPEVLDVIRSLCPKMENLHLCTSYDDTVIALAKFRNIKTLSIFR